MKIKLRKFGSEQCDLPTMIDGIALLLRLVTINIDKNYKKRIPLISYFMVIVAIIFYIYVYVFSMLWFIFVRTRETRDYVAAAVVLSLGMASLTCITKGMFMAMYKKKIQNLVQQFLEYDRRLRPGTSFHTRIHRRLPKIQQRVITVWSIVIIILVLYLCIPIFKPGRNLSENLYILYGLEPMFESPNYEIALTTITWCTAVLVYIMSCIFAFIIILIGYIEVQLHALSEEMLEVWDDAIKNYEDMKANDYISFVFDDTKKQKHINAYIHDRLKEIIGFHIENLNFLNTFEALFRVTMAFNFITTMIAIVAELLGGVENTYMELPYSFVQLYINCYMGQKLLDASNEFVCSIYDCKWENFDKWNKRMVLLMLQNAQKPLVLTAGGLTVLDYVCLMSVIKSTYTLYTTLQSCIN